VILMTLISSQNNLLNQVAVLGTGGMAAVFLCAFIWYLAGVLSGRRQVWGRRQRMLLLEAIAQLRDKVERFEHIVNGIDDMTTDYFMSLQEVRRFMPNLLKLRTYRDTLLEVDAVLVALFEEGSFDTVRDIMLYLGGDSSVSKERIGGLLLNDSINLMGWQSKTEPMLNESYADLESAAQELDQLVKADDLRLKRRQTLDKLHELRNR
jgi:hypothetical protein